MTWPTDPRPCEVDGCLEAATLRKGARGAAGETEIYLCADHAAEEPPALEPDIVTGGE